jgi:hypothetical protein
MHVEDVFLLPMAMAGPLDHFTDDMTSGVCDECDVRLQGSSWATLCCWIQ